MRQNNRIKGGTAFQAMFDRSMSCGVLSDREWGAYLYYKTQQVYRAQHAMQPAGGKDKAGLRNCFDF